MEQPGPAAGPGRDDREHERVGAGGADVPLQRRRAGGDAGGARRVREGQSGHQGHPGARGLGRRARAVPARGGRRRGAGRRAHRPSLGPQHGRCRRLHPAERSDRGARAGRRLGRLRLGRPGHPGRRHHQRHSLDHRHLRHGVPQGHPGAGRDHRVSHHLGGAARGQRPDQGAYRRHGLGLPRGQRGHQLDLVLPQLLLVVARLEPGGARPGRRLRDGHHPGADGRRLQLLQVLLRPRAEPQRHAGRSPTGGRRS